MSNRRFLTSAPAKPGSNSDEVVSVKDYSLSEASKQLGRSIVVKGTAARLDRGRRHGVERRSVIRRNATQLRDRCHA
ncbi:hypothetical protein, partial [Streptomyces europaeiscabiei]|uniref:hypothetical protein n=1 Tax=Streptomyces europaeiscabiei TaxID=146819 RepID=UPI0038F74FCE